MEDQIPVYEAISASRRRAVCQYVATADDTVVTLGEVATYIVTDERADGDGSVADEEYYRRVLVDLHHVHLPKLADAAVLQYESDQQLVRAGSRLPVASTVIQDGREPAEDMTPTS